MYREVDLFDNTNTMVVKAEEVCCPGSHLNYTALRDTLHYWVFLSVRCVQRYIPFLFFVSQEFL